MTRDAATHNSRAPLLWRSAAAQQRYGIRFHRPAPTRAAAGATGDARQIVLPASQRRALRNHAVRSPHVATGCAGCDRTAYAPAVVAGAGDNRTAAESART